MLHPCNRVDSNYELRVVDLSLCYIFIKKFLKNLYVMRKGNLKIETIDECWMLVAIIVATGDICWN